MGDDYYRDHADAYDQTSLGTPGDVDFYRALAVECGGPVVELGVGTGRIAIPIAEAGVEVIGIDLEPAMLAVARVKAAEVGVAERVRLVEGDMRSFTLDEPAPLVTIPYRAFMHNLTTEDQLATLAACRRALRPGGRLALNMFNPDIRKIAAWLQGLGRSERGKLGRNEVRRAYQPTAQVVRSTLRVRDANGRRRTTSITGRYVYRYEMEHLLVRSGFEIEALYGDFDGGAFRETSPEMVWIARRSGE